MCQLFGLNSAKPVAPHFSLRGFFKRGGGTDHHADGWGLAYFANNNTVLQVRDTPAHQCRDVAKILHRQFKASTAIAHVRKATEGKVCQANSHPFVRRLWGRDWIFAHNGELKNFFPPLDFPYRLAGDTDSERAFCYLLTRLSFQFGWTAPPLDELLAYLAEINEEISRYGSFNYLLSDGRVLIAHASTQLYWTARAAPFWSAELLDEEDQVIDFADHNDSDDRVIVVATKPLTRREPWYAMARGELKAFVGGEEYASAWRGKRPVSQRQDRDRLPPLAGWCTGWNIARMEIL